MRVAAPVTLNSRVHGHFRSPAQQQQTCNPLRRRGGRGKAEKRNGVRWDNFWKRFRLHVGTARGRGMIMAIIRDSGNDRVKGGLRFLISIDERNVQA